MSTSTLKENWVEQEKCPRAGFEPTTLFKVVIVNFHIIPGYMAVNGFAWHPQTKIMTESGKRQQDSSVGRARHTHLEVLGSNPSQVNLSLFKPQLTLL